MESHDRYCGLFWLGLGVAAIYGARKIGIGHLNSPGGGLFIFLLGLCLLLLAAIILIASFKKEMKGSPSGPGLWRGVRWQYPVYILGALFFYTLIARPLGYILATLALMLFLLGLFNPRQWKSVIWQAVLVGFLSYLVFGPWLQVRFPRGILENFIG